MFFLLIAVSVVFLPLAARAAFGADTSGTFMVQATTCPGPDCSSRGRWYADRSTRVIDNAEMDLAPYNISVGDVVPATYLGETDPASVYPADENFTWLYVLALTGLVPPWSSPPCAYALRGVTKRGSKGPRLGVPSTTACEPDAPDAETSTRKGWRPFLA